MRYFREHTYGRGVGIGWERTKTVTMFYVRIAAWHHEWSWPRG